MPDLLWDQVAPLLPVPAPRPYLHHGRRRADDRAALAGIVFVLRHGVGWRQVPKDSLGVSGVTCCAGCATGPRPASGPGCTRQRLPRCVGKVCWGWMR
jgi:transposase